MAKITKLVCDLCKTNKEVENKRIQVIFHTEKTEGRSVDPYFSLERFDICADCLKKALEGKAIHGEGAQGHNNYYFRKEK